MKSAIIFMFTFLICATQFSAQVRIVKPVKSLSAPKQTNIAIGLGMAQSVVYLARNINNNNDARGIYATATYDKGNFIRVSLEYTAFNKLNIEPTWHNVKAKTIESNVAFIAKTADKKLFFYPIVGVSYNLFDGYFTGINDYLNLRLLYDKNSQVKTRWFGFNSGVGFDYNFKFSSLFFNFKMRLGNTEGLNEKNIQDVCYIIGYKLNLNKKTLHRLFRGTRSRYTLKTKEAE